MTPEQKILSHRVAELEGVIASALAAMDARLYGDARRILTNGKPLPIKTTAAVLAFPGGAA